MNTSMKQLCSNANAFEIRQKLLPALMNVCPVRALAKANQTDNKVDFTLSFSLGTRPFIAHANGPLVVTVIAGVGNEHSVSFGQRHADGSFAVKYVTSLTDTGDFESTAKSFMEFLVTGEIIHGDKWVASEDFAERHLKMSAQATSPELVAHVQKQKEVLLRAVGSVLPDFPAMRVTATPQSPVKYVINLVYENEGKRKSPYSVEITSLGTEDGAFKMNFFDGSQGYTYSDHRQKYNDGDDLFIPRRIVAFLDDGKKLLKSDPSERAPFVTESVVETVSVPVEFTQEIYEKLKVAFGDEKAPLLNFQPAGTQWKVSSEVDGVETILHTVATMHEAENLLEYEQMKQGWTTFIRAGQVI